MVGGAESIMQKQNYKIMSPEGGRGGRGGRSGGMSNYM
jgi:hypothetical protein